MIIKLSLSKNLSELINTTRFVLVFHLVIVSSFCGVIKLFLSINKISCASFRFNSHDDETRLLLLLEIFVFLKNLFARVRERDNLCVSITLSTARRQPIARQQQWMINLSPDSLMLHEDAFFVSWVSRKYLTMLFGCWEQHGRNFRVIWADEFQFSSNAHTHSIEPERCQSIQFRLIDENYRSQRLLSRLTIKTYDRERRRQLEWKIQIILWNVFFFSNPTFPPISRWMSCHIHNIIISLMRSIFKLYILHDDDDCVCGGVVSGD